MKIYGVYQEAIDTLDAKTIEEAIFKNSHADSDNLSILPDLIDGFGCGCGSFQEEDQQLLRKVFFYAAEHRNNESPQHNFFNIFGDDARLAELFLNILESNQLIDHGSTLRYPWLTDHGAALYAAIKSIETKAEVWRRKNDWWHHDAIPLDFLTGSRASVVNKENHIYNQGGSK